MPNTNHTQTEAATAATNENKSEAFLLEKNGDKMSRLIDSKAAKVVAKVVRNKLAYDSESKSWFIWAGNHWQPTQDSDKTTSLVAGVVDRGCGNLGYQQRYLNSIVRQMQLTGVLNRSARPENVVPFINGLLNIKTGELKPATPSYSTDWVLPHAYDETAECQTIQAWLFDAVDKDVGSFNLLRAWFAALIRGLPIQYILMLIGPGGSGKGVFQRLVDSGVNKTEGGMLQAIVSKQSYSRLRSDRQGIDARCFPHQV